MDNNIFEQMMSRYPLDTSNDRRNATYEVMPFVKNAQELNIWSNAYFVQLIPMIKYMEE